MYMYLLLIYLLVCCAKPAANDSLTWFAAYPMAHLDPSPLSLPLPSSFGYPSSSGFGGVCGSETSFQRRIFHLPPLTTTTRRRRRRSLCIPSSSQHFPPLLPLSSCSVNGVSCLLACFAKLDHASYT